MTLRMAVIGVGHLGKEHARILSGLADVELVGVVDVNPEQARAVAQRCGTRSSTDYRELLGKIDAACIVVPTSEHLAVATQFLEQGVHLLIEKPLARTSAEAQELVELAERQELVLQVGHIERFNPAYEELAGLPVQPRYVECRRLGSYTGRSPDIGCVLDTMIHDLELVLALVRAPVKSVDAMGIAPFGLHEEMATARLTFANGCIAQLTASRLSMVTARTMNVWAPEGFVGVDFAARQITLVQPSAEMRRHGLDPGRLDPASRARLKTDMIGRHFQVAQLDRNHGDQLTRELEHFVGCVESGSTPRVSGTQGRDALRLAEQVLESIRSHPWTGDANGPCGPLDLPAPLGSLFTPLEDAAAA
ncbi:MAG: Gfo/Idh/MocA family oxidoreductase [Gemmataceae bacterium]